MEDLAYVAAVLLLAAFITAAVLADSRWRPLGADVADGSPSSRPENPRGGSGSSAS